MSLQSSDRQGKSPKIMIQDAGIMRPPDRRICFLFDPSSFVVVTPTSFR
jgi:hypothetical protein